MRDGTPYFVLSLLKITFAKLSAKNSLDRPETWRLCFQRQMAQFERNHKETFFYFENIDGDNACHFIVISFQNICFPFFKERVLLLTESDTNTNTHISQPIFSTGRLSSFRRGGLAAQTLQGWKTLAVCWLFLLCHHCPHNHW